MSDAPGVLLLAAVAVAVIGTALCFIGIIVPGVFVPGTRVILAGLLGCAGAGSVALVRTLRATTA